MAARITLQDARWFTDMRPMCEIEKQFMKELKATTNAEYAKELQKHPEVVTNSTDKVPHMTINSVGYEFANGKTEFCPNCKK